MLDELSAAEQEALEVQENLTVDLSAVEANRHWREALTDVELERYS